uniref:Uncharacterized protein n=1 Tax=Rhizophora mucronata TaxID=61149 RepID=A0A2P2QRE8_RHIMU
MQVVESSHAVRKSEHSPLMLSQRLVHSGLEHNLSNDCHPQNDPQKLEETTI